MEISLKKKKERKKRKEKKRKRNEFVELWLKCLRDLT